jgi:multiple sugar transport system substrate-binding protein
MSETIQAKKLGRRDFLKAAGVAAGAIVIVACAPQTQPAANQPGEAPAPKGVVKIKGTSSMSIDVVNKFVETIKPKLDAANIELEMTTTQFANWSEYADKVITQIAGGEQLDVLMIAIEGLGLLGAKNILADLGSFLTADPNTKKMIDEDIHESLTNMLTYQGKLLEIPFSWNNMIVYYNTKVMGDKGIKVPERMTWDDFRTIAKEVADVKGTAEDRYAYSFWGGSFFGMHSWLFMNDGQGFLSSDWSESNLTNPKVLETLQFLADLILVDKVAPNPAGWSEQDQFIAGNLAMRTCGRWCIEGMKKNGFNDFDIVYQPHKTGDTVTVAGTDGWGISTKSKTPSEAFLVAKELSGPECSLEMIKLGGNIPALRSIAEKPDFLSSGPSNSKIFYESLNGAKAVPSPANFNIVEPLIDRHLTPIWNGETSVEDAMKLAHEELKVEMDKLKS